MKNLAYTVATLSALSGMAFAGNTSTKLSTPASQAVPSSAFGANEFQFDLFGTYQLGNGPFHAGPLTSKAGGGGLGGAYFFTQNLGLAADVACIYGHQNPDFGTGHKTVTQTTGSLVLRIPYEEYSLAPYGFIGAGITGGAGTWASGHAGVGVEYRIVPNAVGIFADARWTYYGDSHGRGDLNNVQGRAGVRFAF